MNREMEECLFKPQIGSYGGIWGRAESGVKSSRRGRVMSEQDSLHPFQPKIDKLSDLIVQHTRGN